MKDLANRFDPNEVEGLKEITVDDIFNRIEKLDVIDNILISIDKFSMLIEVEVGHINNCYFDRVPRSKRIHRIDIYSRCITRLEERLNKQLDKLKL